MCCLRRQPNTCVRILLRVRDLRNNEQIQQNIVNFGPKCSPEVENVPLTALAVMAAFGNSGLGEVEIYSC